MLHFENVFEKFWPFQSYLAARPSRVLACPNLEATPSIEFKRLKKDKTFCVINSEDMYDKNNKLEMEYYHDYLPKLMRMRTVIAYIREPKFANPAKRQKFDEKYSRYDVQGLWPVKYVTCPKAL